MKTKLLFTLTLFLAVAQLTAQTPTQPVTVNASTDNPKGTTALTYHILEFPGMYFTNAFDVKGNIVVGQTNDASFYNHGFTYDGTNYTQIDYPGAGRTWVKGIDAQGGSTLAGYYLAGSTYHGFYKQGSGYYTLDCPGATQTYASDVYGTKVAGYYSNGTATSGFVYDMNTSAYTTLNPPNSSLTEIHGIYGDRIVGYYRHGQNGPYYSFIYNISTASFTIIYAPVSNDGIFVQNVDATHLVGYYTTPIQNQHSFYYEIATGIFTEISNCPGFVHTFAFGIDGIENIVGYVENGSSQKGFQLSKETPVLTTEAVTGITSATAVGHGTITDLGISSVTEHGVCWNTSGSPSISDSHTSDGAAGLGSFVSNMSGLTNGQTYYVSAYATNTDGTGYGNVVSFKAGTAGAYSGGAGTLASPYLISTLSDLQSLQNNSLDWGKYFIQTADIDASATSTWASGKGYSPIGNISTNFTGHYDGNGHIISGLFIARNNQFTDADNTGFFGYVSNGTIQALGLTNVNISGLSSVGALAGYITGSSCSITQCYSTGSVNGFVDFKTNCGGLIGKMASISTLSKSYSACTVHGYNYVGGLAGFLDASSVTNSFAKGAVSGYSNVGGLIGYVYYSSSVTNSYSKGAVTGTSSLGGLIGYKTTSTTFTSSYWDTQTSGLGTSNGGTGKTTADMKLQATYTGWDFSTIWAINSAIHFGYPYLRWMPVINPPTVTTEAVTNITGATVTGNGTIVNLGTGTITQHGVCWNTSASPDITGSHTSDGTVSQAGAFTSSITGLLPVTTYYVRAYAQTEDGVSYGSDVSFTTSDLFTGSGTELSPYQITNLTDLYNLSTAPTAFWSKYYIQTASIDATASLSWNSGAGMATIGNSTTKFTGSYDGKGFTISELTINRPATQYIGMFGWAQYAKLSNIHLVNVHITGAAYTGGLVGYLYGSSTPSSNAIITNCSSTGTVTGTTQVGGLVGYEYNYSITQQCRSSCTVSAGTGDLAGGLVGYCYFANILNCYAGGTVTAKNYAGGLSGYLYGSSGSIAFCYSYAAVSGTNYKGGFLGYYGSGTISGSFWDTQASGLASGIGRYTTTGITGLTTPAMKSAGTFIAGTWDFTLAGNKWAMNGTDNNGYPFLRWQGYTPSHIWLGTGTTDWATNGNWSENSSPSAKNILVPNVTNKPVVNEAPGSPAVCNNLAIETGAVVTIAAGKALTVTGTLTNPASAGLVINSDATGTGSLINSSATVPAIVKRYIPGLSQAWHFLSSPVATQAIQPEFVPLQTPAPTTTEDFFAWYETGDVWVNFKNTTVAPTWNTANGSTNFVPGTGYLIEYTGIGLTKQFTGNLNAGTVSPALTFSGTGVYKTYNLLGNPYPSAIDWKAASGWNRDNLVISGGGYVMSIWNDALSTGNYGTFNSAGSGGSGTNGVTQYIPVGQGFMVKAASSGTLGMAYGVRVHNSQEWLKTTDATANILRIKVAGNANSYSDEIVIEFGHPTADGGAEKMFSFYETAPSLYTVKTDGNYSIDFRGEPGPVTIPLSFKSGADGTYTLTATQLESFTSSTAITLEDKQASRTQNLIQNPTYTFSSAKTDDGARFLLHFGGAFSIGENAKEQFITVYALGNTVYISNTSGVMLKGGVIVYNMTGQPVMEMQLKENPLTSISLSGATGYYLVKVVTSENVYTGKVFIK